MRDAILLLSLLSLAAGPVRAQPKRIQVAVLGTFHFGATTDTHAMAFADLFSEQRQGELADVRARLAAFGPTRVFVEHEPSRQAHWDSVSTAFHRGELPTGNSLRNEIFQIGVRLAEETGLPGVTCVDYQIPDPDEPGYAPRTASEAAYATYLSGTYEALSDSLGKTNESFFSLPRPATGFKADSLLRILPLRDYFVRLNSPDVVRAYGYENFNYWALAYGQGEEYVGADFVVNYWLSRNVKIYQNVLRHASPDDGRILVLIGSGHAQMLMDLFRSNPYFEVVEVSDVLG